MNNVRSRRWVLEWVLICATGAVPGAAAHSPVIQAGFTVHVSNYAGVEPQELREGERVAAAIFRKAGVPSEWVNAETASEAEGSNCTGQGRSGPSQIQLHIRTSSMADQLGLSDGVMGLAPGNGPDRHMVYIFYDRVKELARKQVSAEVKGDIVARAGKGQILGEMMAHEIGHVLLDMPGHSETGIMRGGWNLNDLQTVAYGDLLFTKKQAQEIRAEVTRRAK